ncbi:AAA family ATPase [Natrialbaceae archaeon GCM10025810]|uniref:AAA family ATPase n=1 Tax=Halovalidus salilacus TaxID=3075124 RepID=UPI00361A1755
MTDANQPTHTHRDAPATAPSSNATDSDSRPDPLPIDAVEALCSDVRANVSRVIVGNEDVIEHVVTALLGRGHVLLEDVPGVGKTVLARSIARSIDCTFKRVQFTPDLLPSDITGVNVFNQKTREFEFNEGPIFANIVLADEINRAPPKTQAALLEAMEESQVTVDGATRPLPTPFTVIATQNAVEPTRTYDLPFAEIDRFTKKLHLGYPDEDEETELLGRTVGHHPIESLEPVTDLESVVRARETVANVAVKEPVRAYATRLVGYTREHAHIGASPRGSIALLRAAQARAAADGREYVVPDDVKREAPVVLSHRIKPSPAGTGTDRGERDGASIVEDALETVRVE